MFRKLFHWESLQSTPKTGLAWRLWTKPENWYQFNPNFTSAFFIWECFGQLFSNYSLALIIIFLQKNIGTIAGHEMLMKLTAGVNFINVLWAAFTCADPESAKRAVKLSTSFLALLRSARTKAACKMLMKLTTGLPRYGGWSFGVRDDLVRREHCQCLF